MKKDQAFKYLSYPSPVFCIGTYNEDGQPNLMTIVLGGMCSHNPPLFAVSLRAATQTHANIARRQAFTVNVPSAQLVKEVDYVGLVSGSKTDKFAKCGLTAISSSVVDAPYVEQFATAAECEVRHTIALGSHTMFIGEILGIKGDDGVLTDIVHAGMTVTEVPDMERAEGISLAVVGKDRVYVGLGQIHGQAYSIGRHYLDRK
jgi:flavin reductase (DIM6/NTAB) family NADH-FMN oxidoreductase RutF